MGLMERLLGPNIDKLLARRDVEGLVRLVQSEERGAELRCRAAQALGTLADTRVVLALIDALGTGEPQVADAAAAVLANLGEKAGDELGAALGHDTQAIGSRALELLLRFAPPPLALLADALREGNDQARSLATDALVELVGPATGREDERESIFRALLPALGDRLPAIRAAAAAGLGTLADPRAAKGLAAQLKDGNRQVRDTCAAALQEIGPPALPSLLDTLSDRNRNARAAAARLLGVMATEGIGNALQATVVELLQEATGDRDEQVRSNASEALRSLGAVPDQSTAGDQSDGPDSE